MWKYLVVNTLWFSLLFLVHFFGTKKDQRIIYFCIFFAAAWGAFRGSVDPLAWSYYLGFSFLVFYGAADFRSWSFKELRRIEDDIGENSRQLGEEKEFLNRQNTQTGFLERKADEIVEFYEQIKVMSKSLDALETFLIFAEALSEYFSFDTVKLSIFSEHHPDSLHPKEVYELKGADLKGVFDRGARLKDKKMSQSEAFPFDTKVYEEIFKKRGSISEKTCKAYPIFIHDRIFAIVSLMGLEEKEDPLLNVLIERFVAEMQRVNLYERVEMLAITDGLTGMYVRRHLLERLEGEMDRTKRFGLKLSFLMIDVDYFKRFNDEYGHLVGDVVLRQVAETIKKSVRELDFVGRYGGEEFAVGLIETDENTTLQVAERIRKSIEVKDFSAYGEHLKVTVSIGCATYSMVLNSVGLMIEAADDALYQAKRFGRNRVCASGADG